MAEIITPGAAGPLLPPEYQAQIDDARRKQQMAQMLQAMAARNNQGPNQMGSVASKTNPLAALANIATSGLGSYMQRDGETGATDARRQYDTDSRADLARVQGLPQAEAINQGRLSQFAGSRALAETLYKASQERNKNRSGVFKEFGDQPNALGALDGGPALPAPDPKGRDTVVEWIPDPNNPGKQLPLTKNLGKDGFTNGVLGTVGNTTSVSLSNNMAGEEGKMAIEGIRTTLKEKGTQAAAAKRVFGSANVAIDALESGARAGGGENQKQMIRKGLEFFGVNMPETASTEQLQQGLLEGVLAHAKELRPASDTDIKILQQMVGSAGTNPTALTKALAFAQSMALKDLEGYNNYADENKKNLDPRVQSLFTGSTSGYELPRQLTGPVSYQMEVVRQLQRQGFDISKLAGPDGKPFDPNSKFDINPIAGFPGVAGTAPPLKGATAGPTATGADGKKYRLSDDGKSWVPQ
jgi:predicted RecA/RadA family phage recombinase